LGKKEAMMAKRKGPKKPFVFTPARRAALAKNREKAILANIARGRKNKSKTRRHYGHDRNKRGVGIAGLKKNFTPYARINQNSATGGFNVGSIIPGMNRRIVIGGYTRIESTKRKTALNSMVSRNANKLMPNGTTAGAVRGFWNKNVFFDNPGMRVKIGGTQTRLATSRASGPTLVIRRGKHKVVQAKTFAGMKRYNTRMRTISKARAKTKKPRQQRRGKR